MGAGQQLLDMLVCPLCHIKVELAEDQGGLLCSRCRRIYPIVDGLPVMIADDPHIEAADRKS